MVKIDDLERRIKSLEDQAKATDELFVAMSDLMSRSLALALEASESSVDVLEELRSDVTLSAATTKAEKFAKDYILGILKDAENIRSRQR